jgi:ribonucleoside-diphosphate reductase alpha chain
VRAISTGATVTALKPMTSEQRDEAIAFRRDYEERAKEMAEEIESENLPDLFEDNTPSAATALFSDKAAADAAFAKAETQRAPAASDAKALATQRRAQAVMQGYTGNECSECHNFTMVRNGTCEKCDTCGSTSGCS